MQEDPDASYNLFGPQTAPDREATQTLRDIHEIKRAVRDSRCAAMVTVQTGDGPLMQSTAGVKMKLQLLRIARRLERGGCDTLSNRSNIEDSLV